jgi:hypothetical protein
MSLRTESATEEHVKIEHLARENEILFGEKAKLQRQHAEQARKENERVDKER